jgi:ParB family chromosome partitioning protein
MARSKRLGRGLDTLLKQYGDARADVPESTVSGDYRQLPVTGLAPGKYQPRHAIADTTLDELVVSIRRQGVLQPLLVRPLAGGNTGATHEIVAGERRWRAARLAGLDTVPVIVRPLDDQAALAVALIENLQRADLNPVEVAESLARLTDEFGLTHAEAAEAVGRSRSSVSNLMRLLDLEAPVRALLAEGRIDMGHARALLPLAADAQLRLAREVVARGLSVREVERRVAARLQGHDGDNGSRGTDLQTRWLQQQLAAELGTRVGIRPRRDGGHTLGVSFTDLEQLQAALRKIESLIGQLRETAGPRARDSERRN